MKTMLSIAVNMPDTQMWAGTDHQPLALVSSRYPHDIPCMDMQQGKARYGNVEKRISERPLMLLWITELIINAFVFSI